ncbi:hypothetical protein D3C73_745120 [compost metagenome]
MLEKHLVLRGSTTGTDIGAVDGEVHDQCLQRTANRAQGQVASHQIVTRHLQQRLGNTLEIAGQRAIEDLLPCQFRLLAEIGGPFADTLPQFTQNLGTRRIVLQQRQLIHELITGGAIHRPVPMQAFTFAKDLLDVDRQVPLR